MSNLKISGLPFRFATPCVGMINSHISRELWCELWSRLGGIIPRSHNRVLNDTVGIGWGIGND